MRQALALLLLCLLWGMEWLRELLTLPVTPPALRSAIACTLAAVLYALVPSARAISKRGVLVAIGLFAAPVLQQPAHHSGYAGAVLWTLAPVFVIIAAGTRQMGLRQDLLLASLAGVAGALLIFPVQFPVSLPETNQWLMILLGVACAGTASAFAMNAPGLRTTGILCAAVLLWITAAAGGTLSITHPELLWIACIDLPALLLLLWLLQHMRPVTLSTRYLLPLVVTILSSWLTLHPQMSVRFAAGVLLLLASSLGLILFSRNEA